ncbi:MAG: AAA family ATPase [Synergistaceae bacterium]|jgi:predicted ATPase|nr:AAA family ATPase [Synergistaceae bacterium]
MLIHSIKLTNFLSFGSETKFVDLCPLNVIIGSNGSGKSNFLEAIDFLRNTPDDLAKPIREGGGVQDWLWKGSNNSSGNTIANVDVVFEQLRGAQKLRYVLSFYSEQGRFRLEDERVENEKAIGDEPGPFFFYRFAGGKPVISVKRERRQLEHEDVDLNNSILSQRRDPEQYPEITYLAKEMSKIKLYRDWNFGRYTPARLPQAVDLPNQTLQPDCGNLGLVLNQIRMNSGAKQRLLQELKLFYNGLEDYEININSNAVQIFFAERGLDAPVPATRLSDGTLRYLCLLAILCNPAPPPLVCIEEPELGLHPDVLPALAALIKEASEKCQLIVTTHSEVLVDALTDTPESVLVCEKSEQGTTLTRLNADEIKPWLEKYRLGELWARGDIGGNRW